ncbi:hypothetical protein OJE16_22705 [Pantoea tagorei]
MESMAPREKLRQMGAEALSDVELLAIFLRTGTVGANVMALAQQLLQRFGSLYHIMTATPAEFDTIKGVGDAKLAQLHAIAELARRFFCQPDGAGGRYGEPAGNATLSAERAGASGAGDLYGAVSG